MLKAVGFVKCVEKFWDFLFMITIQDRHLLGGGSFNAYLGEEMPV
jgi:hypothetical protein